MVNIALINKSHHPLVDVTAVANALNQQILHDVAPAWGVQANVLAVDPTTPLPPDTWRLTLLDEPGPADVGAYGYHLEEGANVVPVGKVFVKLCERNKEPWSSVVSHEVLEMLGDPWINIETRRRLSNGVVELWPRELCDAVQGDKYVIDGIPVSNFVLPEYFVEGSDGPYDHLRTLKAPFSIHTNGYSAVTLIRGGRVSNSTRFGAEYPEWKKTPITGRRITRLHS